MTKRITKLTPNQEAAVPHPGWECCDPTKDLAGWLARERTRIALDVRWARVLRARGRRLAVAAGEARGNEWGAIHGASRLAHGLANSRAQTAGFRRGRADQVEAAHQYRLAPATATSPPATLRADLQMARVIIAAGRA